jgi:hypothetical protein
VLALSLVVFAVIVRCESITWRDRVFSHMTPLSCYARRWKVMPWQYDRQSAARRRDAPILEFSQGNVQPLERVVGEQEALETAHKQAL